MTKSILAKEPTPTDTLTIQETMDVANLVMIRTGATSVEEVEKQLNSRWGNETCTVFENGKFVDKYIELNSIPLGDWCKDNNYNRGTVFNNLRNAGILDRDIFPKDFTKWVYAKNQVQEEMFGLIHGLEVTEAISVKDLAIFNTYMSGNGKYIVMVNPSSEHFKNLLEYIGKPTGYRGSKGYSARKICSTMSSLCGKFKISI